MKICAIICEYNPLHHGHKRHIELARKKSGADAIMCIMGGNFSQRGEPCVLNKYVRAKMAMEAGADIVVQIPTPYSSSSAPLFALAGVKIANSFDNVTSIAFGCESTNEQLLCEVAEYLAKEPKEFKAKLKKYLAQGNSIATSREKALDELMKTDLVTFSRYTEVIEMLRQPNNILAIEYLKALYLTKSKIKPVFIERTTGYHSILPKGKAASASALRAILYKKGKPSSIKKYVPKECYHTLDEEIKTFGLPDMRLFSDLCLYALKTKQSSEIKKGFDVTEGLENRFYELSKTKKDINELLLDVKTKRYSFSRLKRIVLNLLLNIDAKVVEAINNIDVLPFIKVLAFHSDNKALLKAVSANTNLIIRNKNVEKKPSDLYKTLAEIEDRATQVYTLLQKKNKAIVEYSPDLLTKSIQI